MRRIVVILAVLVALGAAALLFSDPERVQRFYRSVPRQSDEGIVLLNGTRWRPAVAWEFADGPFPQAWSWGDWRFADGLLEGSAGNDTFAVYFCPFEHGGDFLLETRLRIVSDNGERSAEAHLLTRDSRELHSESGAVLFGGQRRVSARHMVDGKDYVLQVVKPGKPVGEGVWHLLRFAVRDGRVEMRLDGALVFASDRRHPVGFYREPHLAVRNGVVQFSNFKIFVAP